MAKIEHLPDGSVIVTFDPGELLPEPEPERSRSFQDVAEVLAGRNAPAWLPEGLARLSIPITHYSEADAALLAPGTMVQRLQAVEQAAALLVAELDTSQVDVPRPVLDMMTADGWAPHVQQPDVFKGVLHSLVTIQRHAAAAAAAVVVGAGRSREPLRRSGMGDLTAREYCALVVAQAWTVLNSKPPPTRNGTFREAADAYWLACGGPALGREKESVDRWRAACRAARQALDIRQVHPSDHAAAHRANLLAWMLTCFGQPTPAVPLQLQGLAAWVPTNEL